MLSNKPKNVAKVDGNSESVSVSPSLVFEGKQGRQYEQTAQEVKEIDRRGGGFRRVPDGWIEVSAESTSRFQNDCEELSEKVGPLSDIRGANIPRVLSELAQATRRGGSWESPWNVYVSEAIKNANSILDTPAKVEFRLNIVESDGRSLLELDPIYNHERFHLTHDEADKASTKGEEWIRRRDTWVKLDLEKIKKIGDGAEKLNLQSGPNGFTFPASQREQVIELFSTLGSIQHSAAYADFVAKLAGF